MPGILVIIQDDVLLRDFFQMASRQGILEYLGHYHIAVLLLNLLCSSSIDIS